ncbi:hypothetical protein ARMSODRAFT_1083042 [Armillaria solidipes]|uniref:G-protein coupled receptors family 3 profile domain-containing protein n=1 Tax=Armillaria solidipes TaxID=1076256 RepID=A0A2H3BL18_9AGAR|nr:hypothetical protein ARMSODRAFT_1083042 [Armillaria solidipes]
MSVQRREDDSHPKALVVAFDTLQMSGLVLLLTLLAPALFSPNVKRTATWFGIIISVIIYCVSYSILMFIGGQDDPEPSPGVCLFQACLVYSTPILSVFCALGFIVELLVHFFRTSRGKTPSRVTPIILLASSSLLSLCVALEVLVVGLQSPEHVQRNESRLYCHLTAAKPNLVVCVLGIIMSLATMIAEVVIILVIRKTAVELRRKTSSIPSLPTHLLVRLFLFSTCICFVVCISVYSVIVPPEGGALSAWYILLNGGPIGVVVTFGTQKDILCFYFRRKQNLNIGQQRRRTVRVSEEDVSRNTLLYEMGNSPSSQNVSLT